MIGVAQESVGLDDLFQQLLALLQINAKQRVAIEIKQVESVVGDGDAAALGSPPPAAQDAGALLHQAERRAALVVERYNFTVKNRVAGANLLRQIGEFGIVAELILIARYQAQFA